jgi:hypothetical protein
MSCFWISDKILDQQGRQIKFQFRTVQSLTFLNKYLNCRASSNSWIHNFVTLYFSCLGNVLLLWNPNVHYCLEKTITRRILRQFNPIHTSLHYVTEICIITLLRSLLNSPKQSPLLKMCITRSYSVLNFFAITSETCNSLSDSVATVVPCRHVRSSSLPVRPLPLLNPTLRSPGHSVQLWWPSLRRLPKWHRQKTRQPLI